MTRARTLTIVAAALAVWVLIKVFDQNAPQAPTSNSPSSRTPSSSSSNSASGVADAATIKERVHRAAKRGEEWGKQSGLTENIRRALPVEPTVSPAQSPAATPNVPTYRVVNVRAGDSLTVRAGPGSNYPIVARLRPGTGGITYGRGRATNGPTIWQEISASGYPGWVNEAYLAPESSAR